MNQLAKNLRPAKVIVVDDSQVDIDIIRNNFHSSQVRMDFKHYTKAELALHDMLSEAPDIIFIDRILKNPGLSGDDLTDIVCKDPKFNETIIVVMSAKSLSVEDEAKFAGLRVDFFFDKPLIAEQVISMVKRTKKLWLDVMVIDENK